MRSTAVPILTILTVLTLLGPVFPSQPKLHAVARVVQRQVNTTTTTTSTTSASTSTSSSSSSSSSQPPSSTTSTTSSSSTSSTTTSSQPISTSSTSSSESSSTRQSSSVRQSSSSTPSTTSQQPTSTSSTSSLALSDLTNTGLSLPTAFTSTFASTGSDGSSFTVTAVVSRPTGLSSSGASTAKKGFFANTGAVAGTFVVVGLFGTAIFLCVFVWILRRYRRRKNDQEYFNDEYKEFNRASGEHNRGTTPDPTLPAARGSTYTTPAPSTSALNMIERLHGNESTMPPADNMYYDQAQGQYQDQMGEFNPYQAHDGAYAYSDDHGNYAQYPQSPEHGQQEVGAFAYEPQVGPHAVAHTPSTTGAGPSHTQQNSFYQVDSSLPGQAH